MVFAGFFPTTTDDFEDLREALEKLELNDASFSLRAARPREALGFGFRCGFLGLLHMEIVQERLEREYDLDMIQTAPNVTYEVRTKDGKVIEVHRPASCPTRTPSRAASSPTSARRIISPTEYIGTVMQIATDHRGDLRRTRSTSREHARACSSTTCRWPRSSTTSTTS